MAMPRHRLRERRERRGLTQADVAAALHVADETYATWERGTATPRTGFRSALAGVLDVSLDELAMMLDGEPPAPNGHVVPEWLDTYASLEQGASCIWAWEPFVVHGLLQTGDYAAAIEAAGPDPSRSDAVAAKVANRTARQGVLARTPEPLRLTVVLDESVLHRMVGSHDVMADQLARLADISTISNVDLRVLPLTSGVFAAGWGAFSLMATSGDRPTMAFTENRTGVTYLSRPFEISAHWELFEHLHGTALGPAETTDLIRATCKEHYL